MQLKMTQPDFKAQIWYRDLDQFVNHHYRQPSWRAPFKVVAEMEWHNDNHYVVTVEKGELQPYDEERWGQFLRTGYSGWGLDLILQDMANRDLIEEGEYLIWVSW